MNAHPTADLPKLLSHFVDLINTAAKVEVTTDNAWKNHGQVMLIKAYHHLESIALLAGYNRNGQASREPRYVDHSSVAVLGRAAYETFVMFYFIFCIDDSAARQFRHQVWRLNGLVSRSKLNGPTDLPPERKEQIEKENAEITKLTGIIESDPLYLKLPGKTRRNVRNGDDVRLGLPLIDLAEQAGLPRKYAADMYNHFCSYAHGGAVSAFQIDEAISDGSSPILARATIGFCCVLLSQMMLGYSELFEEVDGFIAASDELVELIALWQGLKDKVAAMY